MGIASYGLFVNNVSVGIQTAGTNAAIISYWTHGFISPALFITVTIIKNHVKTFHIWYLGGIKQGAPLLTTVTFISLILGMGVPIGLGFYGEFLTIFTTTTNFSHLIWIVIGIFQGIIYSMRLFWEVFLGGYNEYIPTYNSIELSYPQIICYIILLMPAIIGCLYPGFFL
jgi:NADH-quinone oxidoreductase subunit M